MYDTALENYIHVTVSFVRYLQPLYNMHERNDEVCTYESLVNKRVTFIF